MKSIGFVGFGKMATAIWQGAESGATFSGTPALFYRRNTDLSSTIETQFSRLSYANLEAVCQQDCLIFAVKPQQIRDILKILPECRPSLIISILAGTPISVFEGRFGSQPAIARVMPNTPCIIQSGMTGITFNDRVDAEKQDWITRLFSTLGQVSIVSESELDIVTGISGSGPAFLYEIADIIAQVGREHGLSDTLSLKLIAQTMVGAGQLLLESEKSPNELINEVCSPGGTTITGLTAFRESRAKDGIRAMIRAAIERSRDLSHYLNN